MVEGYKNFSPSRKIKLLKIPLETKKNSSFNQPDMKRVQSELILDTKEEFKIQIHQCEESMIIPDEVSI